MADKETALTIKRNFARRPRKYLKQFTDLPIGDICDAQGRVGALDYRIKPVGEQSRFCGTALTVDSGPRDNLAAWAALEIAKPEDNRMPTHKVFYFSHAPQNVYDIIREEVPPGFELVTLREDAHEERMEKLADCEAVIAAARPMTREFVAAAPALKLLHPQGVGYEDTVDVKALKARRIAPALTPAGTTIGAAGHTLLLCLAVCRRLPYADRELRQGNWHINSLRP